MSKIVVGYILLLIPAAISWRENLKVEIELSVAGLRSLLQLLLMSSILLYVFSLPNWANVILVLVMLVLGAVIAFERGRRVPFGLPIAIISIGIGYLIASTALFASCVIKFVPNIFVPLSGMLIGNATKAVSLSFAQSRKLIFENSDVIEAAFLDGADYIEASRFLIRDVLKVILIPQIDGLKLLGLVHIPGTMSGLLIAGMPPLEAAAYQLSVAYAISSVAAFAAFSATYLSFFVILKQRYERLFR